MRIRFVFCDFNKRIVAWKVIYLHQDEEQMVNVLQNGEQYLRLKRREVTAV